MNSTSISLTGFMVSFVNQMSAVAQRYLNKNTLALNQSLDRLSSGYKINHAKDDVAGYQISNKLNAKIRGNQQAIQNAQDGISMLSIAENTFFKMNDNIQRMRELTVQYASDTLGPEQRNSIKQEVFTLIDNIQALKDNSIFNGKPVFEEAGSYYDPNALVVTNNTSSEGVYYNNSFSLQYTSPNKKIQIGTQGSNLDYLDLGKVLLNFEPYGALRNDQNDGDQDPLEDDNYPLADGTSHTPAESARAYLLTLDAFSQFLTTQLSAVGLLQNRLQNAVNSLTITTENYQAANSRIIDVDIAKESANLTRNQILQQASISVLSQANQQSYSILKLVQK